ncbi:mandelate racemase/muconate lactonizing enzyme [Planoprotostelium fungivorum]|uniref:Mandelate racemase/muconate lactonizing enzyme n=1 Tax=Planoprotostelium fungivorum TaxID=1890364 RepID=A0A2P6NHN8_9EUKA|nr:mandelate racemase/muconate lactonizing enzyme [Planoprotostelium fungivorum]
MSTSTAKISSFTIHDVRFPTSLSGDGTDAMNTECDYSSAYIVLHTEPPLKDDSGRVLEGHGMTFTIGRGNDIVCAAIRTLADRLLVGRDTEELFSDMGKTYYLLTGDPQLRWIGPEKGVIALATAACINALFDLFAKTRNKPLWKLITDMKPEELVKLIPFKYIDDFITPQEALDWLREKEGNKKRREERVKEIGYPAYTTSVGWLGYSDEKVVRLTKEAIRDGFTHFKLKVGSDPESDKTRIGLVKSVISDPRNFPENYVKPDPSTTRGKNADPNTGCVLMVDANQVWSVNQAIDYMREHIVPLSPWFIEEPTAPDDVLGHATIRRALKAGTPVVGVASGEHAHNRMLFKQMLQSGSLDVVQIDACRMGGLNEVLAVLLMAAKAGVPVCPHAGGVGLCELVVHLSLIDFLAVSGPSILESETGGLRIPNVLEYVDHLHEHFVYPVEISERGTYEVGRRDESRAESVEVPRDAGCGYSCQMKEESFGVYDWPEGSYWKSQR